MRKATTSKEGGRGANHSLMEWGGCDEKYQWGPWAGSACGLDLPVFWPPLGSVPSMPLATASRLDCLL